MTSQATAQRRCLERAERVLRRIIPDVKDTPIYIVDDAPPEFDNEIARGWTGSTLDLVLADHLRSRGDWRGRGWAIVLRVPDLLADMQGTEKILGVVLHEAGHRLDVGTVAA